MFAKLMLEGGGDAFQVHLKHEVLTVNLTKLISQTKNQEHMLTEASFAKLTIEGEGDAFWLHQTLVFNGESNEGDSLNQKLKIASAPKPVS
jgi:hypothetical protein